MPESPAVTLRRAAEKMREMPAEYAHSWELATAIMWDEFAELLDGHYEINLSEDPGDDYSLVMWDGREYRHDWSAVLKTARAYLDEA